MATKITTEEVLVGERADGSKLSIPVIRIEGEQGPKVFYGATIHGDETTGQASLWKLLDFLKGREMKGTLIVVPVMNPEGFNFNVRGIPEMDVDLNRLYPGDQNGSLGERLTAKIWEMAKASDIIVDIHTSGWCIPFILLDPVTGKLKEKIEELALATGVTVLNEFEQEKYQRENLGASLPGAALKEGKVTFTIELGGFKGIDWGSVEAGFLALKNTLIKLGMVEGTLENITMEQVIHKTGYRRKDVYSTKGGLIQYDKVPGSKIRKGELLAKVRNVFGEVVEDVLSPDEGFVIALNPTSLTYTGGYIAEIAVMG